MNLQNQNKKFLKISELLFQSLPQKTFVLNINQNKGYSNLLFVSPKSSLFFFENLKRLLEENHIAYSVSEDAFLIQSYFEIAYLNTNVYDKRVTSKELYLYQNRSTSWSIGNWLIEGFWANILESTLLYGDHNIKEDKAIITKEALNNLEKFLGQEISNKSLLLMTPSLTNFEKHLISDDIKIAKIRRFFAKEKIFLKGFKDMKKKYEILPYNKQKQLDLLLK